MTDSPQYQDWTKESLIERIRQLEDHIKIQEQTAPNSLTDTKSTRKAEREKEKETTRAKRKIDTTKWSTRYVAFKLAYLGKRYAGYEHQIGIDVPTIESELWKALTVSRLVTPEDPTAVFTGCEYSKCGRTDRGVSSFGQVIGLRVRSKRPPPVELKKLRLEDGDVHTARGGVNMAKEGEAEGEVVEPPPPPQSSSMTTSTRWDPIKDEFEYCKMLNRLLPHDIRILAWCPSPPPGFSARFSCRERQYRYFFTQPAFLPLPPSTCLTLGGGNSPKEGWLDIDAMRSAARLFEGEHDFRNLCKIDPSKQISNYRRRIFEAEIEEVVDARPVLPHLCGPALEGSGLGSMRSSAEACWPKVYSFNVNGSAFLWHQIRHMVAILFMVGQGLEEPSIVTELLDVERTPRRPMYTMADDVPLVLWDCIFPELDDKGNGVSRADTIDWIYVGDDDVRTKYGVKGIMDVLWEGWRSSMMDEFLSARLLGLVAAQGKDVNTGVAAESEETETKNDARRSKPRLFFGGNTWEGRGAYVPLMKRTLQQSPDEQNEKHAVKMGYGSSAEMKKAKGYR